MGFESGCRHNQPERRGEAIAMEWRQGRTHTGRFAWPGLERIPATGRAICWKSAPSRCPAGRVRPE
jgi:hypothetical protein